MITEEDLTSQEPYVEEGATAKIPVGVASRSSSRVVEKNVKTVTSRRVNTPGETVSSVGKSRVASRQDKSQKKKWVPMVLMGGLAVVTLTAGYFVTSILNEIKEEKERPVPDIVSILPEEGQFIDYLGMKIPVEKDVPINSYDGRGFYFDEQGYMHYEVDGTSAIAGIDVSYHQKTIDWEQVAEAGFEFAIIRAGRRGYGEEGNFGVDTEFEANITGALKNNMDVGVYFFSQAINMWELVDEINFLLEIIEGYDITYPVVFDWEFVNEFGARTNEVTGEEITEMAVYFCDKIQEAGYIPAVYFNSDMAYRFLELSALKEYPFWLAELSAKPRFYYHFDILQYTFTGVVPGIEGDVDLNLSFRDFAAESAALKKNV